MRSREEHVLEEAESSNGRSIFLLHRGSQSDLQVISDKGKVLHPKRRVIPMELDTRGHCRTQFYHYRHWDYHHASREVQER